MIGRWFKSRAEFGFTRWLFARSLGLIFFAAFASLAVQMRGLAGVRGISPVAEFLPAVHAQLGRPAFWHVPTFCWLSASDGFLVAQCVAGALIALVMVAGFCPGTCALICWALYLSLCSVCSPFLDFQWDALLLETALLAAFFLPWSLHPQWRRIGGVARISGWLLWWLLFRLMFESGVVKLSSGDPTWRDGSAFQFHFFTQPLPLWTAWYVHQLPDWTLRTLQWCMFGIELVAPWLIFGPRRARHAAAGALVLLQVVILATGNYAFFNLLTIALCLLLIEDRCWPPAWRLRCLSLSEVSKESVSCWPLWLYAPVASVLFLVSTAHLVGTFRTGMPLRFLARWIAPLRSTNGYGLFAVMTTRRLEIEVQGSNDGQVWRTYSFTWKPGDTRARPMLVAPHQPRLDWQLWFAALGDVRQNPWLVNFLVRLLQGSPEVLALLESNPFPDRPPRYVRAVSWDYRFTTSEDRNAWWKRELRGLYCPPLSLKTDAPPTGGEKAR